MANGGWYGTAEEWQRLEQPLLSIDDVLEEFARSRNLEFSKNAKESPERSLRWGASPRFLIQVYIADETKPTWNLWLCCSEDRADGRYWRNDFAVRDETIDAFGERLPMLLEESFDRVEAWGANPVRLELATPHPN